MTDKPKTTISDQPVSDQPAADPAPGEPSAPDTQADGKPKEFGGPKGPEPTRYGDWERKGRCVDF